MSIRNYKQRFWRSYNAHLNRRAQSVSLIAGQNVFGSEVAEILGSDLGNRVVETFQGCQLFPAMEDFLEIERLLVEIIQSQLTCNGVEIRPLSGTSANFIIYKSVLGVGESVASVSVGNGAHVSWSARTLKSLGYNHISLPYCRETCMIDNQRSIEILLSKKPKVVVLGGSVVLFEDRMGEIVEAVHSYGGKVVYDAAHIIGHILSDDFSNPLHQKCDYLTFTMCKTIPGPQHAIICGSREALEQVTKTSELWHSGYHLHEVAASTLALIKFLENKPDYSQQMIRNARALSRELSRQGTNILTNKDDVATQTYMFLADVSKNGGGKVAEENLAKAGILVSRNLLPGQTAQQPSDPDGLRFGVAEITSLGMRETEMEVLGKIIHKVITEKKPEKFASNIRKISENFQLSGINR